MTQVVKGWDGVIEDSKFRSQCGPKKKEKKTFHLWNRVVFEKIRDEWWVCHCG